MSLVDQLKSDTAQALKEGESLKVETLRGLLAAIHNKEIELKGKGRELVEEEVLAVLGREAKKRKEANQIYSDAGRTDLAGKELKELDIIKSYLPPEMGADEIESIARKVVEGLPALSADRRAAGQGMAEFGQVMGMVIKETKGRAEPGVVKEVVERILGIKNEK